MSNLPPNVRVSTAVLRYVTERLSRREIAPLTAQTIRANLHLWAMRTGDPALRDLGRDDILRWMERGDSAPSTMRTRLSEVRVFCQWAVENHLLNIDPTLGIKGPRQPRAVPRALRHDDVSKVLSVCRGSRDRLVVLLMVQEGLRRKEVAGLEVGDIDPDEGSILVRGKGGHERVLPLSAETTAALAAYLRQCPALAGPVIRSEKDGRSGVAPVTVGRLVSALMFAAGVKERPYDGRSGHSLRHTAATDMLRHKAHLRDVQAALGHRSLATTERYLSLQVDGLRVAMGGRSYAAPSAQRPPRLPQAEGPLRSQLRGRTGLS